MKLKPNAKINLGLYVVRKRPDGYHDLETVFYPIPLCDEMELVEDSSMTTELGYHLSMDGHVIDGSSEDNLVVKALRLLQQEGYAIKPVEIKLKKIIPSGAGMGGGSADAAFMLSGLNNLFELQIPTEKLEEYAARLGADCAVFIQNKPVYAEGIGNNFTPIDLNLKGYWLVVIKPDVFISTKAAFSMIQPKTCDNPLLEVIKQPVETWRENMHNDFEDSVFPQFPVIKDLKEKLYACGAIYASMSGSGSSLFGIFKDKQDLESEFPECFYACLEL